MSTTNIEKLIDKHHNIQSKVEGFGDVLNILENTHDKKKMLWKEIYQNAITDRENASILFTDAFKQMSAGTTEHITLGPTLSKYLERMCKSNEQILRLAELIAKAEERSASLDTDQLFEEISN